MLTGVNVWVPQPPFPKGRQGGGYKYRPWEIDERDGRRRGGARRTVVLPLVIVVPHGDEVVVVGLVGVREARARTVRTICVV